MVQGFTISSSACYTTRVATQTLAMDVLVDVVKENLTQFCRSLQLNTEHDNHGRRLGFQVILLSTPCHMCTFILTLPQTLNNGTHGFHGFSAITES